MAEEQKSTIYNVRVTAEDALKTLAELKLRSQELRDQQKALGKVTEENAQEYYALDNQIKAINSEANKYQKQIQNNIKLQNQQEASLNKLRTQLALDNAEFAELGNSMQDAARKAELGKRIAETTEELKAQEEALGDYRRSVGNYEKATDNLKQELNDLTDTLIRMAQAGDTSSASFKEMVKRAGELKAAEDTVNTAHRPDWTRNRHTGRCHGCNFGNHFRLRFMDHSHSGTGERERGTQCYHDEDDNHHHSSVFLVLPPGSSLQDGGHISSCSQLGSAGWYQPDSR